MSQGSNGDDHAMAQQYSHPESYHAGYQNNGQYYMPSPSQYTQQQHTHIPNAVSAPNFYNNGNISPLRKPSPIRRTQSFEVEEPDLKLIKRRISQTQITSPNLPRAQNRASRSNSSTNISPPQRQQGPSSPDYRARSLSSRGSSPSRSTSPSRKAMVNIITRPDTNIGKAICATLTATNKTTETLAIELGDRSLLPEVNMFLSGAERADGWDQVEKLLIDWMVLQNTSGSAQSVAQAPTSGPINHQAAIITSPKQNPVVSASPGKSDHWTVDPEEPVATKYFLGNQMNPPSQNPYYSTTQGNWANSAQLKHAQQYVDNYRNGPHVNQNGYREPIQQHTSQINNFPRSPEKNSAQQIQMQKQQYMNGSPREEERTKFAPPSWQTQNRPTPNPQPIFSSPRDQTGPAEKQYSASTTSTNGFSANNMYINQQPSQAPHLQQQPAPHQHHANLAPHQRLGANFEGNYQNEQSMSHLTIADSPHNGRVNPFYNYDNAYSYEYPPYEAHEAHQQPQSIVNSTNQSAVMRRY